MSFLKRAVAPLLCLAAIVVFAFPRVFDAISSRQPHDRAAAPVARASDEADFSGEGNTALPTGGNLEQGLRVHFDPVTGQIIPPPVAVAPAAPALPANHPLSTSGEGLVETPGQTRAGGVILDLQGRFRSTVVTSVGPDGTPLTRCLGPGSAGHPQHCPQCPTNPPSNP
jgi:hypothetical protein